MGNTKACPPCHSLMSHLAACCQFCPPHSHQAHLDTALAMASPALALRASARCFRLATLPRRHPRALQAAARASSSAGDSGEQQQASDASFSGLRQPKGFGKQPQQKTTAADALQNTLAGGPRPPPAGAAAAPNAATSCALRAL